MGLCSPGACLGTNSRFANPWGEEMASGRRDEGTLRRKVWRGANRGMWAVAAPRRCEAGLGAWLDFEPASAVFLQLFTRQGRFGLSWDLFG